MENRDTYDAEGSGPSGGFGGDGEHQEGSGASQTGAPTAMDQSFEEERQRRQESWSPGSQTGFDNDDVERQKGIYTDEPADDPEEERRDSVDE